jgi:broad specificity phosphatase PhoE
MGGDSRHFVALTTLNLNQTTMVHRTRFISFAFSHIHSWLPPPTPNFRSACQKAGVTKIGFLRHGNTSPKPQDGHDFDRQLTDLGREQVREAGASFGRNLKPFYATMLVSPAPRTMETAQLFLKSSHAEEDCAIKPVQGLYDGTMHPEGSVIFQKIGYAALIDYVDTCADKKDKEMIRHLLGLYANAVIDSITNVIDETNVVEGNDFTLWMVGHAIYLPAAALGVATQLDCHDDGLNVILSSNTKEAEGYLIDVEKSEAMYLSRSANVEV